MTHRVHNLINRVTVLHKVQSSPIIIYTVSFWTFRYLEIPSVVPPLIMGMMMVFTLQKYFFQGKPFDCFYVTLSSVIVAILSLSEICIYVIFFIMSEDLSRGWTLIIEAVGFICAWLVVLYLACCYRGHRRGCCTHWRKIGYICCLVTAAFLVIAYGTYMCVRYKNIFREEKDAAGYVTLLVFIHILAATCLYKHPSYLPNLLHIMVYMFGAVGLSSVNAIALASELILKAETGARTIGDLRVIVFSLETVFLSTWLTLQIYSAWMSFKDRTKQHFEDDKEIGPEVLPEMEVLSNSHVKPNHD
ncbi:uncharacterized protein LOC124396631 isoform X1 [Silurus meridionalis]|uniref:uncharacterized protein LOC124396631 isoform X1 n=2 Tax=Silurus meridionalis TaxID=175797 RepID=UPI001EEA5DD8|nr:uncharacterized protein LOC124396631 isoform X1 [Silurus meridionalis]